MLILHWHHPQPTGVFIKAGFCKNNLPQGKYVAMATGQLWVCECKSKFVELDEGRLAEIDDQGALAQYDRAGNN